MKATTTLLFTVPPPYRSTGLVARRYRNRVVQLGAALLLNVHLLSCGKRPDFAGQQVEEEPGHDAEVRALRQRCAIRHRPQRKLTLQVLQEGYRIRHS